MAPNPVSEEVGPASVHTATDRIEGLLDLIPGDLVVEDRLGFQVPVLRQFALSGSPGAPLLPQQTRVVAVPFGQRIVGVDVSPGAEVLVPGVKRPMPTQPPHFQPETPRPGINPERTRTIPNFYSLEDRYLTGTPYPDVLVDVVDTHRAADGLRASVRVRPVQYDPRRQSFVFFPKLRYALRFAPDAAAVPAQPRAAAEALRDGDFDPNAIPHVIITDNYRWPDAVQPAGASSPRPPSRADRIGKVDPGAAFEATVAGHFYRLARWKTRRGVRSRVVTISDIVAGKYEDFTQAGFARDLQEVIRNFIKYANDTWQTKYVLLAGAPDIVPMRRLVGNVACAGEQSWDCTRIKNDPKPNPPNVRNCYVQNNGYAKLHIDIGLFGNVLPTAKTPLFITDTGERIFFDTQANPDKPGWFFIDAKQFNDASKVDNYVAVPTETEYVMVAGPQSLVDNDFYWLIDEEMIPSDIYYASLSKDTTTAGLHDLDPRNNGFYGQSHFVEEKGKEFPLNGPNGQPCFNPEYPDVYVGRAPVRKGEEARNFVNKVIAYERLQDEDGKPIDISYISKQLYVADFWTEPKKYHPYIFAQAWSWPLKLSQCPEHFGAFFDSPGSPGQVNLIIQQQILTDHSAISNWRVRSWTVQAFYWRKEAHRQNEWRWCPNCQALHFTGTGSSGACFASIDGHGHASVAGTADYVLALNDTAAAGEAGWAWCSKCQGLFRGATGPCADGETHDFSGSGAYTLAFDYGAASWCECQKCHGLYYAGGDTTPDCPCGGGPHDYAGSKHYSIPYDLANASMDIDRAGSAANAGPTWTFTTDDTFSTPSTAQTRCVRVDGLNPLSHLRCFSWVPDAPPEDTFSHRQGQTITKIHIAGGMSNKRLIAYFPGRTHVLIPQNGTDEHKAAGSGLPKWYFSDAGYTTASAEPTNHIVVEGPEPTINPDSFILDDRQTEQATAEKERIRKLITEGGGFKKTGLVVERLYADFFDVAPEPGVPAAKELQVNDLYDALASGPHLVTLSGHGSPQGCCGLKSSTPAMRALPNRNRYFIAYAFSCSTARPDCRPEHGTDLSLGAALVVQPHGAVAYVGATRVGHSNEHGYERNFWKSLAYGKRLGEAVGVRVPDPETAEGAPGTPPSIVSETGPSMWSTYVRILYGDPEMPVWRGMGGRLFSTGGQPDDPGMPVRRGRSADYKVVHDRRVVRGGTLLVSVYDSDKSVPVVGHWVTFTAGWASGWASGGPAFMARRATNIAGWVEFTAPSTGDVSAAMLVVADPLVVKPDFTFRYRPYVASIEIV